MSNDWRREADPDITSWCVLRNRPMWHPTDEHSGRPIQSTMVYEREFSVRVCVGADKLMEIKRKDERGFPRRTGETQPIYQNYGWIYSWRGGDLRAYTSTTGGGHRLIRQVQGANRVAQVDLEYNPDIMRALADGHERARGRGLDLPEMVGGSVTEMVHRGAFPMLELKPRWQIAQGLGLGSALRAKTLQEFTRKAFGARAYRKDLVKAVGSNEHTWMVAMARHMTKAVPVDWIVEFLRSGDAQNTLADYAIDGIFHAPIDNRHEHGMAEAVSRALAYITPESRRRLLRQSAWNITGVRDTVNMVRHPEGYVFGWPEIGELRKVRSWHDWHEQLTTEMNRRNEIRMARQRARVAAQPEGGRRINWGDPFGEINPWPRREIEPLAYSTKIAEVADIKQTKIAAALDGLAVTAHEWTRAADSFADDLALLHKGETVEFEVRSAKQTSELAEWGSAMRNCIASYSAQAIEGRTNLFGVYVADELVANMEVSREGRINQLFGRFNNSLEGWQDKAIQTEVAAKLEAEGLAQGYRISSMYVPDDAEPPHPHLHIQNMGRQILGIDPAMPVDFDAPGVAYPAIHQADPPLPGWARHLERRAN